uniref:PP2C family protein-serine/threonine phosphatase n=1 Tax=Tessaracoccus bendigoensis TaxID=72764 RepID=UPI0009FFB33C|nr:PP2C family serine/threonine-protein phosphatase [Tessaracoccus bendigoensis]
MTFPVGNSGAVAARRISYAALTACGGVREANQDAFVVCGLVGVGDLTCLDGDVMASPSGARVFAVVDGMGGHRGGEDAAVLVAAELARSDGAALPESFDSFLEGVSAKVHRAGLGLQTPGMGAAMALLAVTSRQVIVVNVGDCRAYKLADGYLGQLSIDDRAPGGAVNVLTQSLGGEPRRLDAHALVDPVDGACRYLLCSDGIHGFVDPVEVKAALVNGRVPTDVVQRLSDLAERATQDNFTAVVLDVA